MSARYPIPQELKLEAYERRKHDAELDNLTLTLNLIPGNDGVGAICQGFIDAIANHDVAVRSVEDQWVSMQHISKDFKVKNRIYRNIDGAWNTLSADNKADFDEFQELIPRVQNAEERLKVVKDPKVKIKLETDWARFQELEPTCQKLDQAKATLEVARVNRDAAQKILMENDAKLTKFRSEERNLSSKITDDHVIADEKGIQISAAFPNIQPNSILHELNGVCVEDKTYKEIVQALKKLKPPHETVFRRYDYRYDPFHSTWHSLSQLREMGVFMDDPMITKSEFVRCAAVGDFQSVKSSLLRGEDPNCTDYTGCTALIAAAGNRHSDMCELLIRAGADAEKRDTNQFTPLLATVKKGFMDIVRQLCEYGADRTAKDKNKRNGLYFALTSGSIDMVKFFLNSTNSNEPETLWGFTPMHTAANQGNQELVEMLLAHGGSIYRKCNQGRTPEDVAREGGFEELTAFLEMERFNAPGQLAFRDANLNLNVWIGDFAAMNPVWASDVGVTEVICMPTLTSTRVNTDWLKGDETCKILTKIVDTYDDDASSAGWDEFAGALPVIATHLTDIMKRGDSEVLLCDPTGKSTAAALLAITLLMRYQYKTVDTLAKCAVARPNLSVSLTLRKGLELTQRQVDEKKLKRLDAKIRNAVILSGGF